MPDPSKREELRARVHGRAKQIVFRRRLRIAGAFVATAAVIAAIAGVALLPGSPVEDVRNVAAEPVATTEPSATPEPTPSPKPEPTPQPTPIATAEPLLCRNSFDPACGKFRWDPEPAPNKDMEVELFVDPQFPTVGEEVTFMIRITDDTSAAPWWHMRGFGDTPVMARDLGCQAEKERYGPWSPPEPQRTVTTEDESKFYDEPGTYKVEYHYTTASCGEPDPFSSSGVATMTLKVAPERSPQPGV